MPAAQAELRERLAELTIRDEHRLERRLKALRRHPESRAKLESAIERARATVDARRALVPARIDYPAELPVSARRED